MRATIGRIVLYQASPKEVLPAIVLRVGNGDTVDLEVFGMLPPEPNTAAEEVDSRIDSRFAIVVSQGKPGEVGRWWWPVRELDPRSSTGAI